MIAKDKPVLAIGEAMVELAPIGDGVFQRGFAGDTFNTAWQLAQVLNGRAPVGYVSRVGNDAVSQAFLSECVTDGLGVSGVSQDTKKTMGLYLIELDGAERSFQYWRNDSAARLMADDAGQLAQTFEGAGLIHLSGITVAILAPQARAKLLDALKTARANGTKISFDPNIRPKLWASLDEARATLPDFFAISDIALPSFDDEHNTWGDATPAETISRFEKAGVREVIVKNGASEVFLMSNDEQSALHTPPASVVKDTSGAGDAFNAGYLAARILGADSTTAVMRGQLMAREVIKHFGARIPKGHVPRL